MESIINLIANEGIAVAMLIYFMWYNNTIMKDMQTAINELTNAIRKLEIKNET